VVLVEDSVVFQAPPLKGGRTLVSVAVLAMVEVLVFLVSGDRVALHAAVVYAALHAAVVYVAPRVVVAHAVLLDHTTSREGMGIQTRAQFLMHLVLSVLQLQSHLAIMRM
jgi:hypothetical protein